MSIPLPPSPALADHLKAAARQRAHLLRRQAEGALLDRTADVLAGGVRAARHLAASLARRPGAGRAAPCITEA